MKKALKETSEYALERLSGIKGLTPYKATASFYMMVGLDCGVFKDIQDEEDFCRKLFEE